MKLLELHYSTSWAGAERFVIDLCNELSKTQDVVLCIIEDDIDPNKSYYKKELSKNVKYINLKCQSGLQIKALWKIFKTICKEKPDVVHTHTDALAIFLPSIFYKRPKYFQTLHTIANECISVKRIKPIYKYLYKKYIKAITISDVCYNSYNKFYGLSNAYSIDNGRSSLTATKDLDNTKKYIETLKINKDDKVYIHIARYDKVKNQELLINCFNKFIEDGKHGILIILGTGYDSNEGKKLLSNAKDGIYWLGLKNNVCDYLLCSDFFLLTSIYEGLPISLLEAISCGVIPISTPAGGVPNVIKNHDYGYISKDFSEIEYYKVLSEAYYEYNSFNRQKLKDYFLENYSIEKCAQDYLYYFLENKE